MQEAGFLWYPRNVGLAPFDPSLAAGFIRMFSAGHPFDVAALEVGLDTSSVFDWAYANPDFNSQLIEACRRNIDAAAVLLPSKILSSEGPQALERIKAYAKSVQFLAERLVPEKYSPTVIHATRGKGGQLEPLAMIAVPPKE